MMTARPVAVTGLEGGARACWPSSRRSWGSGGKMVTRGIYRRMAGAIVAFVAFAAGAQPSQIETNKRIATEFYDAAINRKDFAAASRYLGSQYKQHNPTAADGAEGLRGF